MKIVKISILPILLASLFLSYEVYGYEPGDVTENWTLFSSSGDSYSLYDYEGKLVLVMLFNDT
jgi:hypothetical protein